MRILIFFGILLLSTNCLGATIVSDTWTRTLTDDWGSADTGGAYTEDVTANYDADGSIGTITPSGGSLHRSAWIYGSDQANSESLVTITDPAASTTRQFVMARFSATDVDIHYECRSSDLSTDVINLFVSAADGTHTSLGSVNKTVSNLTMGHRLRCEGTTISCKVWDTAGAEPGAWDVQVTDSTLTTGRFALGAIDGVGGSIHNFDDYTVDDLVSGAARRVFIISRIFKTFLSWFSPTAIAQSEFIAYYATPKIKVIEDGETQMVPRIIHVMKDDPDILGFVALTHTRNILGGDYYIVKILATPSGHSKLEGIAFSEKSIALGENITLARSIIDSHPKLKNVVPSLLWKDGSVNGR